MSLRAHLRSVVVGRAARVGGGGAGGRGRGGGRRRRLGRAGSWGRGGWRRRRQERGGSTTRDVSWVLLRRRARVRTRRGGGLSVSWVSVSSTLPARRAN